MFAADFASPRTEKTEDGNQMGKKTALPWQDAMGSSVGSELWNFHRRLSFANLGHCGPRGDECDSRARLASRCLDAPGVMMGGGLVGATQPLFADPHGANNTACTKYLPMGSSVKQEEKAAWEHAASWTLGKLFLPADNNLTNSAPTAQQQRGTQSGDANTSSDARQRRQ